MVEVQRRISCLADYGTSHFAAAPAYAEIDTICFSAADPAAHDMVPASRMMMMVYAAAAVRGGTNFCLNTLLIDANQLEVSLHKAVNHSFTVNQHINHAILDEND